MTTGTADVSVIIPTYNRPMLLRETLDSVLAQTLPVREIIVVDNGLSDDTGRMITDYGDAVTYVRMEPLGMQAARNRGAEVASSTWIAFLDDDDLYRPDFMEKVQRAIDDGRADMISTDHRKFISRLEDGQARAWTNFEHAPAGYWDGVPRPAEGETHCFIGKFPPERLLRFNGFYPSTLVMRKAFFQQIGGYDPGVRNFRAEDFEFLSRALPAAQMALVWEPLVDYRLHPNNKSASPKLQFIGRCQGLDYIQRKNAHNSEALAKALVADLPGRRLRAFDLAFGEGEFASAKSIAKGLRPQDWTLARRVKALIYNSPAPAIAAFVAIRGLARSLRARMKQEAPA